MIISYNTYRSEMKNKQLLKTSILKYLLPLTWCDLYEL